MMAASSGRRRSRQVALQVLYAFDLGEATGEEGADRVFETFSDHFELPEGARAFAKELVGGVAAHRDELDGRIGAAARNWRLERMAAVDRNILRMAVSELLDGTEAPAVIINEAMEVGRRFSTDESGAFLNGVLDAIRKSLEAAAAKTP